jgi:hypothetical protein
VVLTLTPLKAGWLNEGLMGGIKRGNQGGGVKTSIGISMLEAGRRRVDGGGDVTEIGQCGEGDEADERGPYGSDVREKASLPECAKSKEIHLLANTPRLLGPNGLSMDTAACGAKRASTGEARPGGPKSEEISFANKNWIFEYTKALEICTRRFRRNFDMRIFPKIF